MDISFVFQGTHLVTFVQPLYLRLSCTIQLGTDWKDVIKGAFNFAAPQEIPFNVESRDKRSEALGTERKPIGLPGLNLVRVQTPAFFVRTLSSYRFLFQ